jgi:hypothetical protein
MILYEPTPEEVRTVSRPVCLGLELQMRLFFSLTFAGRLL